MPWKDELLRPATVIAITIALATTVVGAAVAFYFYQKGEKAGRISLAVDQVQVFDKSRLGQVPLRVLDASGNIVNNNVFAANVTLWNSGNAEIHKSDVRKPFRIKIGNDTKPLDLAVTSYSNDNVDQFQLSQDGVIDWQHFDPGEGFKARIVYVNDEQLKIELEGSAVGTKQVEDY